jgi:hypothetical protein
MKTVIEELIAVRNKVDELIKRLESETEIMSVSEECLENIIFNPKLFNTSEKVTKLKRTIGSFISENPVKDEMKVDAKKMNQFFCLYAALWSRPHVLANEGMVDFVRQMALWFPQWVSNEKKQLEKFRKALSSEKSHWMDDKGLKHVMDWKMYIPQSKMKHRKAKHFERLAREIYLGVNQLVKGW